MKQIWCVALLILVFVVGCGGDANSKVVGTWRMDVESVNIPGMTPDMKKMFMASPQAEQMKNARLEFKSDGTFVGTGMGNSNTGKWTVTEKTIKITDKDGKAEAGSTYTLSDDGAKIHMTNPMPGGKGDLSMDLVKA